MMRTLAFVLTLLLTLGGALAEETIGRVKASDGMAWVERDGNRIDARAGLPIMGRDVLETGDTGRIAVTFSDNTRFSVGPATRVALDKFQFDTTSHEGEFESSVERGTVAIVSGQIAKQTPDAMKVRTPTSILGVRGTRFIVEVDG